jgi:hypothetical protein
MARRIKLDPTKNVMDLVKASERRLDDLREAEARRITEQMELRACHSKELREAEAKRIDAIRAVDVAAVKTASDKADRQAEVLAGQVASSAEALRLLVASTNEDTSKRITAIEKAQYEQTGGTVGAKNLWAYVFAIGSFLIVAGFMLYTTLHK